METSSQTPDYGELARLQQWKAEQLQVESEWDCQMLAKKLGVRFDQSCRAGIQKAVLALLEQAQVPRLRPLAGAGPVPDGAVRVTAYKDKDEGWLVGDLDDDEDTDFIDIYPPEEVKPDPFADEPARPPAEKPTSEEPLPLNGKTWIPAVGDVVRLKSGGPEMTVNAVESMDNFDVVWISPDGFLQAASFPAACLVSAKESQP